MENKHEYKYQWSSKVTNGEIMVIRNDSWEDLWIDVEAYKTGQGAEKPVESHPEASSEPLPQEPMREDETLGEYEDRSCKHENYWVNIVKKEGKNKGKHFKVCKDCKEFIGWTSEELSNPQ